MGALLDEMYPPALAARLRAAGHDVVAVLETQVALGASTDDDVLAWATKNNRCVVTENVGDFARLAQLGASHAGLVFVSSRRFPRTPSGLVRLEQALAGLFGAAGLPGRDAVSWLR